MIHASVLQTLQYRVNLVVELVLMAAEPVVYLVVWQTIARDQGGELDGFTEGRFAAYYIAFVLVRSVTQSGSPLIWERAVQRGDMSAMLLRPTHPVHQQLAYWIGFGMARGAASIPICAVLMVIFEPDVQQSATQIIAVPATLGIAQFMRTVTLALIGFSAFWLTRVAAVMSIFTACELLVAGRIVPTEVLPDWARMLADVLPFRWAFAFPIEVLIGPMRPSEVAAGLAIQLGWSAVLWLALHAVWRRGVRRYGAVGG